MNQTLAEPRAPAPSAQSMTSPPAGSYVPRVELGGPLPSLYQPANEHQPQGERNIDTTGQVAPPGFKPRVTATLWEDEGSFCFQVEARGICVARREDNHMVNGTKLLNVVGMTRGRRDGILKAERVRHVVKVGPMHLKGVWIPFERALDFANKENITEMLYPLFVNDIGALLYHPTNQARTQQIMAAAEHRKKDQIQVGSPYPGVSAILQYRHMGTSEPQSSGGRPSLDRAHMFPTPPTSASSVMSGMDPGLGNARSMPATPETTPPGSPLQSMPSPSKTTRLCRDAQGVYNYDNSRSAHDAMVSNAKLSPSATQSSVTLKQEPNCGDKLPDRVPDQTMADNTGKEADLPANDSAVQPKSGNPSNSETEVHSVSAHSKEYTRAQNHLARRAFEGRTKQTLEELESNLTELEKVSETAQKDSSSLGAQLESRSPGTISTSALSESDCDASDGSTNLLSRVEQERILLDRLMRYFFTIWSTCESPSPIRRAAHTSAGSSGGSGDQNCENLLSGQNSTGSAINTGNHNNQSRKRLPDESEENEDADRNPKKARLTREDGGACKRLACPYFKNNPQRYHAWRSCPGPGWETNHRVKEHLYRNHALPISCPRCHTTFESERHRDAHVRSYERCEVRSPLQTEGFDATQKELLRRRRPEQKKMSEGDKWREVYMILFTDTDPTNIPSPYHDYSEHCASPTSEFERYEQFLRSQLPARVRQQLEIRIAEALSPVEETLRDQIVDIFRDTQLELFDMYRSSRSRVPESSVAGAGAPPQVNAATVHNVVGQAASWSLDEKLQAVRPEPYFDWNSDVGLDGFDGLLFGIPQSHGDGYVDEDSAYGTLSSREESQCPPGVFP
ncbi:uncharacterized protein BCR38DRAFT_483648 [Pseudomassariella vexata]|uniref:HTH APSES-type domain-containing protein n=1 Tax=Pseudomassariella vexata TaxID=1141098 RepID=A0A1Y2E3Q9_9PEZI|nr:uncharacterized protein BCR38DRAFT_483648 [Pseudomassariella vexata]ORY65984.1 hypothetical protein BCR38DRAFT_483648 [Pseudomassariella vexata]